MLLLAFTAPAVAQEKPGIGQMSVSASDYDTLIRRMIRQSVPYRRDHPDSAERLLQEALTLSRMHAYTYGALTSLTELGNLSQDKGDYQKAVSYYNLAIAFAQTGNHLRSLSTIYNNISNAFSSMGMYEPAVQTMYKAILYAEEFSSTMSLSIIYANVAAKLPSKKALYYLNKSEDIARKEGNALALGQLFINKGYILYTLDRENLYKSKQYFERALEIGVQKKSVILQHSALMNLGDIYIFSGEIHKALPYLSRALSLHGDKTIAESGKNHAMGVLASAYLKLNQYRQAEQLLLEIMKKKQGIEPQTLAGVYNTLSELYRLTGQYELSLHYKDIYVDMKDSISRQEANENINRLEIKYRTAQKDKEITEKQLLIIQQKRNLDTKNIWIAGIGGGAVILVMLLFVVYRTYRHRQTIQENRIRILQQQQEIGQLKAMMKGEEKERIRIARELHDGIGGMLTALKMNLGTARKQYPVISGIPVINDVMRMLEDTNEEVRKTAHNLMPDILIKHGLEEALLIYCSHINAAGTVRIDLQLHGRLDELDKGVELFLYRISQELIQNIVKHANASYAVVQIMQYENSVSITVEDNGTGFDPSEQNSGFGLQNLRYRVQALEGTLSVMSAKGKNTTIHIEFEWEKLKLANG